jgi:gliding motility-associated-like protein
LDGVAISGATSNPYEIDASQTGSYHLSVLDDSGCSFISKPIFFEVDLEVLDIEAILTDQSCASISNGSIELSIDSPNMPFVYAWSNGATTSIVENLDAGTYSVTVTDSNGCFASETYVIVSPEFIDATVIGDCISGVEIFVDGTIAGAVYQWYLNGVLIPGAISNPYIVPSNAQGEYFVTVSNGLECTESYPIQVDIELDVLDISGTVVNLTCFESNIGSISLDVNQINFPLTYLWNNGETSPDIENLAAGSYIVTVTDANGCSGEMEFTVYGPDPFINTLVVIQPNMGNLGSATVFTTGGTQPYTYQWSNGNTTNLDIDLTAGSYSITVTDENECQEIFEFEIITNFSVNSSFTDVSCFGSCDGSISLSVDGPEVVYSVIWDDTDLVGFMPNNVCAGTYNYIVTDEDGLTFGGTVTVSQPDEITITASHTDLFCDISENTNIALSVSGGTFPYSYSWTNGSINDTLFNVGLGNYTVTVTDNDGCTENSVFVIDTFPSLNLSFITTLTSCNGDFDGTVDMTVSGGQAPFFYQWSNDSIIEDLLDLAPGTYSVTVTDTNNCMAVDSVDVNMDPGIEVSDSFSNINCPDLDDGSIYLDITDTSSDYDILWNIPSDSNYIYDLAPGDYSVTITNLNGCVWIQSYALSLNSDLNITGEVTDNLCFQEQVGSINMQIDNSNSPYNLLWSNGSTDEDLSNISAGQYEFSLIDSFGCEYNYFYNVEEGPEMVYTTSVTEPGCNGVSVDSISINPIAGSLPFTYLWSNGDTTNLISNIQAGYHYLTITDNEGCIKLDTFLILENSILEVSETIEHNPCYGDNQGQISLEISGGLPPYELIWNNTASTAVVSALADGEYSVTITDAIGCEINQQYTVTEPDSLEIINEIELPLCFDDFGSISIEGFGGIEPYSILWSTGAVSSTINVEPGNSYEVMLTDVNNCSAIMDFDIAEIDEIDIVVLSVTQSGSSNDNGEVVIDVSGGTPPYQIVWDDGQIGPFASGLGYGLISVNVVDANGCMANLSTNIDYDPLILQNAVAHNLCFGECKGTVVLEISDGILPYTITWSDGQITPSATNLCNGIYQATIVDGAENQIITEEFVIYSPTQINIDGQVFDISCVGNDDGQIGVNASGGSLPFEFSWNNGMTSQAISSLSPGDYQVTVIDENDCINSSTFTLEDIPLVDFELEVIDFDCDEEFTSLEVIGYNIYNYPIYINDSEANLDENDHIPNLPPGTYTLSYQINETCIMYIDDVEILNPNETQINLNIESADLKYGDLLELTLEITSELSLSGFSIDWELINYYDCTDAYLEGQCKTILITASENEVLEVIFTDDRGCTLILTAEIRVDKTVDIFIPNVFSPNGDGSNDFFKITSNYVDISVNRFMVFDRWGNNVYSQQNVKLSDLIPWNGMFGDKEVTEGVFVYLLELTTTEGEQIIKAGDITVIR